jgi:hypothetical protein
MTTLEFDALREDFCAAVRSAIEDIGLAAFKETSFFGSNEACDAVRTEVSFPRAA